MRERRTLRALCRGWKRTYGVASEPLPQETGRNRQAAPTEHRASPRPYHAREES